MRTCLIAVPDAVPLLVHAGTEAGAGAADSKASGCGMLGDYEIYDPHLEKIGKSRCVAVKTDTLRCNDLGENGESRVGPMSSASRGKRAGQATSRDDQGEVRFSQSSGGKP